MYKQQITYAWYFILSLLMFFSFYYALGSYTLLNNNEGLYASIAKNMLLTKSFIIPYLNCVPYIEKPPLLYWLLSLSFSLFGFTAFAARLVTATSATLLCFCMLYFTHKIKLQKMGIIATLIFASSIGVSIIARMVYFDMLLTFLVSTALLCLFYWYETKKIIALRLAYLCLALAILTKGLVAIILVGGSFGTFLLLEKKFWGTLCEALDWPGVVLFLAMVLPWHITAILEHKGFFWNYIVSEHFLRFLDLREPHDYYHGSIYYYLPRILIYLFPWSFFIPIIFLRSKHADPIETKLLRFGWCWLIFTLIFFSLAKAKANYYMIIGMPALALILGIKFNALLENNYKKLIAIAAAIVLIIVAVGITFALKTLALASPPLMLIAYGLIAGISSLIFIKRPEVAITSLAGLIIPIAILTTSAVKLIDKDISSAEAGIYLAQKNNDTSVYIYQDFENYSALAFYANTCFKIIDSTSSDLYYGAHLLESKQWFVTKNEFLKETKNKTSVIIVPTKKLEEFYQNLPKAKRPILQKFNDLTIVQMGVRS